MPNRLAQESSPYLLQHAENPVDWHPWGQEALERAAREEKPIFLSIGYSACHWCHVMEHESFEDPALAQKLNDHFVPIKVDREERPDLDQIYMNAVQMMTGRGGWPMSVFLTPDRKPFYGGTYWPPTPRQGMPGFGEVLDAVHEAWLNRRDAAISQAVELTERLQGVGRLESQQTARGVELLKLASAKLEQAFDFTNGGFGTAPKFPHPMDLSLLLRVWDRTRRDGILQMVTLCLDKMARGGIYDHLGGGFARYSVDERWLVPHFEKMLYDNAQLAGVYLEAFLVTGHARYGRIVRETCDYVLNYLTDDKGGFHSTEDADSEGVEGKFYVWSRQEIVDTLGAAAADRFCYVYDVTAQGNFEGHTILNLPKTVAQCAALRGWELTELERELASSRQKLLELRDRRVRPAKDDKVLTSWNALMVDTLARAAAVFDAPHYLVAAQRAADFLLNELQTTDRRLLHTWRNGRAQLPAYLDDYAYLVNALQSLYEATFDERWIDEAVRLAETILERFADTTEGGFFFTADDHEQLIARNKDVHDSSVPSGNGMAATALLRLGKLVGRNDFLDAARGALDFAQGVMEQTPAAAGQLLIAADWEAGPAREIVFAGGDATLQEVVAGYRRNYFPRDVVAARSGEIPHRSAALEPIFDGKECSGEVPSVYVCQDFVCQSPATGAAQIEELWRRQAGLQP